MSLLGKILAIMNVLLAIGVLVLANIDWGVQQGWNYAVFRRVVAIVGLPVNDKEVLDSDPEEPLIRELTPGVLANIFEGANGGTALGGSPVKTVNEELARVNTKITSDVNAQPNDEAKKNLLRAYLYPLARTLGEREEMRDRLAKPSGTVGGNPMGVDYGLAEINRQFEAAKKSPTKGAAARREIRANAAFLLGNLSQDADWRKRVMVVVGMEAYIDGVSRQADAMLQIANDLYIAMNSDRAKFEEDHTALVQLILRESEKITKNKQYLADLTAMAAERTTQVAQRKTEKEKAETDLATATADAQKEVARLQAIQQDLFAFQQRLGQAMQKNLELENELQRLEQNKR